MRGTCAGKGLMLPSMDTTFVETKSVDGQVPTPTETSILTADARAFLLKLAARFEPRRQELLARRRTVQQEIDHGKFPDFLPETAGIRQGDWKVAAIPKALCRRKSCPLGHFVLVGRDGQRGLSEKRNPRSTAPGM